MPLEISRMTNNQSSPQSSEKNMAAKLFGDSAKQRSREDFFISNEIAQQQEILSKQKEFLRLAKRQRQLRVLRNAAADVTHLPSNETQLQLQQPPTELKAKITMAGDPDHNWQPPEKLIKRDFQEQNPPRTLEEYYAQYDPWTGFGTGILFTSILMLIITPLTVKWINRRIKDQKEKRRNPELYSVARNWDGRPETLLTTDLSPEMLELLQRYQQVIFANELDQTPRLQLSRPRRLGEKKQSIVAEVRFDRGSYLPIQASNVSLHMPEQARRTVNVAIHNKQQQDYARSPSPSTSPRPPTLLCPSTLAAETAKRRGQGIVDIHVTAPTPSETPARNFRRISLGTPLGTGFIAPPPSPFERSFDQSSCSSSSCYSTALSIDGSSDGGDELNFPFSSTASKKSSPRSRKSSAAAASLDGGGSRISSAEFFSLESSGNTPHSLSPRKSYVYSISPPLARGGATRPPSAYANATTGNQHRRRSDVLISSTTASGQCYYVNPYNPKEIFVFAEPAPSPRAQLHRSKHLSFKQQRSRTTLDEYYHEAAERANMTINQMLRSQSYATHEEQQQNHVPPTTPNSTTAQENNKHATSRARRNVYSRSPSELKPIIHHHPPDTPPPPMPSGQKSPLLIANNNNDDEFKDQRKGRNRMLHQYSMDCAVTSPNPNLLALPPFQCKTRRSQPSLTNSNTADGTTRSSLRLASSSSDPCGYLESEQL